MRSALTLLLVVLAFASTLLASPEDDEAILGVWRGKDRDLPAVTLTITDEGGQLARAILFYLIRTDPGKAPSSSPGIPEPLLQPRWAGKILTFQVSHRRAHPPRTLSDHPVTFRLKLVSPNEGVLIRGDDDNHGLKMFRDQYLESRR